MEFSPRWEQLANCSASESPAFRVRFTMRRIQVKVTPNARTSSLEESDSSGLWRARVRSPPADGKANEELMALIAERFECPKSAVSIRSGASGGMKLVQIEGV